MVTYTTKTLNNFPAAGALADADNVAVEQGDSISRKTTLGAIKAFIVSSITTGVSSVFGRSGAVVAASGDYTASQVTNVPAGNIAATDVQAAVNELDSEKVAKSGDTMTGVLTINAGTTFGLEMVRDGGQGVGRFTSYGSDSQMILRRANGSLASPTAIGVNERFAAYSGAGYDSVQFQTRANFGFLGAETWSPTANGCYWALFTTANGSTSPTLTIQAQAGVGVFFGTGIFVGPNRTLRNRVYTVATLPVTGIASGDQAVVTDALAPAIGAIIAGGGAVRCTVEYDGANWRKS